jgi:hypothetical protein
MGQSRAPANPVLLKFAGRFLGAIYEDGAVAPETLSASAPEYLRCLMLRQQKSPQSTGAWLNLGFAQRRMALYRLSGHPKPANGRGRGRMRADAGDLRKT